MIDLVDAASKAETGAASALMRRLQAVVAEEVRPGTLPSISHIYVWQDSVLMLSYVDKTRASYDAALLDASALKTRIDALRQSYAIAIKGRPFPPEANVLASAERVTVLRASSWAMANCFRVDAALKRHKAVWYLDSWIVRMVHGLRPAAREVKVAMLPKNRRRTIHLYYEVPWQSTPMSRTSRS